MGKGQVRAPANHQIAVVRQQAMATEGADLLDQCVGVDDHALAQHASNAWPQNARRNQVRDVLFPVHDDGVAGVGAATPTRHHMGVFREQVDDLALAFIAPLSANNYYDWHLVLRLLARAEKPDAPTGMCFLVHVLMESKRNGTHGRTALVDASGVVVAVAVPAQVELGQAKHDFVAVGPSG